MRIGVDLDGVLCNFNHAFLPILEMVSGRALAPPPGPWPAVWDWPTTDFALTEEEVEEAFELVGRVGDAFWSTLEPLPGAVECLQALNNLSAAGIEAYFVTKRPGNGVKYWTEIWLQEHGMEAPTVLPVLGSKGPLVAALDLDAFIDDKPSNCHDIRAALPACAVSLLAQPYNTEHHDTCRDAGIQLVSCPTEWVMSLPFQAVTR
jgi:hypothetical protein